MSMMFASAIAAATVKTGMGRLESIMGWMTHQAQTVPMPTTVACASATKYVRGGVMSCYCDFDPADIWNERNRRARKQYTCYECREKIEPGDEYVYISTLAEGRWSHYRICDCCEEGWKILREAGHCYLIGGLQEAWEQLYE